MNPMEIDVTNIILLVLLILIMIYLVYDSYIKKPRKKTYVVRELLTCTKCKFNVERDFEPGDFIGIIKGKCPSCGGDLKLKAIYAVEKK
ncbi:MAG: hypothetical protein QXS24_01520 [Desulfurococcaceae archaeon]